MIGYYCRGGGPAGMGHMARARALAEVAGANLTLIVPEDSLEPALWAVQGERRRIRSHPGQLPSGDLLDGCDVLVVDDYQVSDNWLLEVRRHRPLALIDDWQRTSVRADCLVNPNVGAHEEEYASAQVPVFALGGQYALVRREFTRQAARSSGASDHVVIALGAADPRDTGLTIAKRLVETTWYRDGGRIDVLAGRERKAYADLQTWAGDRLRCYLRAPDYAAICARARLLVCAASTVSHECAALGRAFLPVAIADNQRWLVQRWRDAGIGGGLHIWEDGWLETLATIVERLLDDNLELRRLEMRSAAMVDGEGPSRVWRILSELSRTRTERTSDGEKERQECQAKQPAHEDRL